MRNRIDPVITNVGIAVVVIVALFGGWAAFSGIKETRIDRAAELLACQEKHINKNSVAYQDCVEAVAAGK